MGEVLSGKTVESLPLNGRNSSQLALLMPGAVTPTPGAHTTIRGAGARPYTLRGNVFEFYRNSDFDANTWERNRSGAARAKRKQHIFGATLGGPIVKEKLFFFVNYQGSILDEPGSQTASVAPVAWRRGDLSSLTTQIRDPRTGLPFPGNQIPLNRISPTALAKIGYCR